MASIIPGYAYDIFISYRQKDNKHDGWVTKFVADLKGELEATFKEDVSIYFDENPHDGLLEMHDVDKSLEGKLKCLIFIPILSQTYCDPNCFAWQHEFCAFNKLAKEDSLGLNVKLRGGNVTSRILPVKINDLDPEDNELLEKELGGFLRAIEFIYKEPGVNRPLTPGDDPKTNLNRTSYRNQINKVANAIKDIIRGMGTPQKDNITCDEKTFKPEKLPDKKKINKQSLFAAIILAFIIAGYFLMPALFKSKTEAQTSMDKSIAVMPFANLSNDPEQEYFSDGMLDEILDRLFKIGDLKVISRTTSMRYKNSELSLKEIANELGVATILEGSVRKLGNNLRITVQLIDARTDTHLWSEIYDRDLSDVFEIQSEIAQTIARELKAVITPQEKALIEKVPTDNLEAYNYFLIGNEYYLRSYEEQDYSIAISMYTNAIELDPGFALAYIRLALCHASMYWFHYDRSSERIIKSKEAIDAAISIDPEIPEIHLALGSYYYWCFLDYQRALKELDLAEKKLRNNPESTYFKACVYRRAGEWKAARENLLLASELDPGSSRIAFNTAETLFLLGEYKLAEDFFNKTTLLNPAFIEPYWLKSLMLIKSKGNTVQARETIKEALKFKGAVTNPQIVETMALLDLYDGHYQKAITFLLSIDLEVIENQFYFHLKSFHIANIYRIMGNMDLARQYYEAARIDLENRINQDPNDPRLFSTLGKVYAGLGLKEEAIESGKKGVELMPIEKEAYRGVFRVEDLARIYVMTGEYQEALKLLEHLLSVPGPISVKLLLLDPTWKPLWDLPDFKKITNKYSRHVKYY